MKHKSQSLCSLENIKAIECLRRKILPLPTSTKANDRDKFQFLAVTLAISLQQTNELPCNWSARQKGVILRVAAIDHEFEHLSSIFEKAVTGDTMMTCPSSLESFPDLTGFIYLIKTTCLPLDKVTATVATPHREQAMGTELIPSPSLIDQTLLNSPLLRVLRSGRTLFCSLGGVSLGASHLRALGGRQG